MASSTQQLEELSKFNWRDNKGLAALYTDLQTQALRALQHDLPAGVLRLNKLVDEIQSAPLPETDMSWVAEAEQSGVQESYVTLNGEQLKVRRGCYPQKISSNETVLRLSDRLRRECSTLINVLGSLRVYLQLQLPGAGDANAFNVQVQQDTVGEISQAETGAFATLDLTSKYLQARGKLTTRALKEPRIADYQVAVAELDQKEYLGLRMLAADTRNSFATLFDQIQKNADKVFNFDQMDHKRMY